MQFFLCDIISNFYGQMNDSVSENMNGGTFVELSFFTRLGVCIIGILSNGLLLRLLFGASTNNTFTSNYIRINLAVSHMLFDVLQITRAILVLKKNFKELEAFPILCTNVQTMYPLHVSLNYLMLAANHYCLLNSCKRKIYSTLISRRKTLVYILASWFVIILVYITARQETSTTAINVFTLRCHIPLRKTFTIPVITITFIAMITTVVINYCVYRRVVSCLKNPCLNLRRSTIITKLQLVRSSLIIAVWTLVNFSLVSSLHMFLAFWKWEPLYYARNITYAILILTVQLSPLIAQAFTDRTSIDIFKRQFPCFRDSYARRRVRVGFLDMATRTTGRHVSQSEN